MFICELFWPLLPLFNLYRTLNHYVYIINNNNLLILFMNEKNYLNIGDLARFDTKSEEQVPLHLIQWLYMHCFQ